MKCPNCGEQIKNKKGMMNFCGFCGTNLKTGEKSWAAKEPAIASAFSPDSIANPYPSNMQSSAPAAEPAPAPVVSAVSNKSFFDPYSMPVQQPSAPAVSADPVAPLPSSAPVTPPLSDQQPQSQINFAKVTPPSADQSSNSLQDYPEFQTTMPDPSYNPFKPVTPPPAEDAARTVAPPSFASPEQNIFKNNNDQSFVNPPVNEVSDISEQIGTIESSAESGSEAIDKTNKYEPVINVPQRNVEISSDSSFTYMQYTHSSKDLSENENNDVSSRYSSYSFGSASGTETDKFPSSVSETAAEPAADPVPAAEPVIEPAPVIMPKTAEETVVPEPAVNASVFEPAPAADPVPVPEPVPAPAPVPDPVPAPVPEPVVPKETIINFIGQNKSSVESMLRFKGLVPAFVYITDESKYDTVISQSIPGGTEVETGTEIEITVSAGTWSEWSENAVPASSMRITETKTQYRRRNRTRTTDRRESNTPSGFEDYSLVDTTYKYSNWVTDQYFTSESVPLDNTCEIVTQAIGFKYAGWFNPSNISAISFSTPDVANFFNNNMNINWMYDETISDQNIKPDVKNWRLANDTMAATPAGDSLTSNIFFSAHVINGKAYAMKFGSSETKWYVYRRRILEETIYHFEKEIISDWSEWSDWTDQEFTANDDCEVQTRTLSRSRRKNSTELDNE